MNVSSWIVGLWLVPVTVFILIPLLMLVVHGLVKLSLYIVGFMKKPISATENPALKSSQSVE
jgi:ABC-type Fe3+ transport system permease subunit